MALGTSQGDQLDDDIALVRYSSRPDKPGGEPAAEWSTTSTSGDWC